MSRLLAKIMLALLMLPLGGVVYVIVASVAFEVFRSDDEGFLYGGVVTTFFVGAYWTLLWRTTVCWTRERVLLTALAAFPALVLAVIAAALGQWAIDDGFGYFVACPVLLSVWLFLTVLLWRETPGEHADRLRAGPDLLVCPRCGYNMTGLAQSTCPECGARYTIDELLSAQPGRDADLRR